MRGSNPERCACHQRIHCSVGRSVYTVGGADPYFYTQIKQAVRVLLAGEDAQALTDDAESDDRLM